MYLYDFKWKFENYSKLPHDAKLHSFCFYPTPEQEWNIEFIKSACLHAYLNTKNTVKVRLAYESTLCDSTERVYYSEHDELVENGKFKTNLLKNFSGLLLDDISKLPNDILILKCTLKFYAIQIPIVEVSTSNLENRTTAVDQMLLNLESIFEKSEHCDVTLKVDGVSIETHKAILCASSPIFSKMFTNKMKETTNNVIDITDISAPIMKQFIALLYCPILKKPLDFDTACNLYYASDKYEVLSLRSIIGEELIKLRNNENALEMLSISDKHNDNHLKEEMAKYVKHNLRCIVHLDSWEQFVVNNGKLASTLITNYFKEFIC